MLQQKKLLLIDDDPDHLLVCALIFQKYGYDVLTLSDCDGLMAVVRAFRPDLIFMDYNMPNTCGYEAIRILKTDTFSGAIPIIYFSAEDNLEKLAAAAGADAYIKKPFDIDHMLNMTARFV